jgi:hypothetical protein
VTAARRYCESKFSGLAVTSIDFFFLVQAQAVRAGQDEVADILKTA